MQNDQGGNGSGESQKVYRITLDFDPASFTVTVGGRMQNYDMGIAMCRMAIDALQFKKEQAASCEASQGARIYTPE